MAEINIEEKHKELDLIQDVIKRMAHNSYLIKGWALSIIAGLFVLIGDKDTKLIHEIAALLPILSFWYLDSFYLQLERKYRKLYEDVIIKRENNDRDRIYDLSLKDRDYEVDSILRIMRSKSTFPFYIIPLLASILLIIF